MITIVLVDDHKMVRQGIRNLLNIEPDLKVVGDADNGLEGLKLIRKLKPDVLITDLKMDGMDGLEVTLKAKELSPNTQSIILSMYGNGYVSKAFKSGARGYIVKGAGIDEVVQAIRTVVTGEIYVGDIPDKDI